MHLREDGVGEEYVMTMMPMMGGRETAETKSGRHRRNDDDAQQADVTANFKRYRERGGRKSLPRPMILNISKSVSVTFFRL